MFRIQKELKNIINRSQNLIFLQGENIHDVFYNDFYLGTLPLKESLYHFFRKEYKCDIALYLDVNLNIICFNKKTQKLLEEYVYGKDEENEITEPKISITEKANRKKSNGIIIEKLSQLDKFINSYSGKKFIYIESVDWSAELFNFHMHNYEILKALYSKLTTYQKDIFTVVSLNNSEMFNNYNINTNSINFLTIPFAKEEEYFDSFYRHLFLKYKHHIIHEKLYSLSSAFKTNNYSLKDAVILFSKHLKQLNNKESDTDIFLSFNKYFSTPIEEKIDFDNDLILDKDIKERIRREFRNFIERKPEAKKGIILTGPPGTGKTMIAKSVANMEGFHFMPLRLSDLKQLYVGHSGAEVKKIFDKARSLEPTVIFIDEIDAIFPKRDDMMTDSFAKDITNEFISQTDGVDTGKQRIFIIGATNIPEVLDSAVISRFELQTIPLPASKEREKIFESYIPSLKENNWQRLNKFTLLDKTEGLSGRDIKDISNTIKTLINKKGSNIPDKDIFDISLEIFKEKVISTNRDKFEYISMKKNRTNFNNIVGYNSIKKEIKNAITSILREAELKYYNIEAERGILLEGPPGNGKSFIAQCIAGEFNLDFIKVLSKDIATRFYSEDAKKLSEIFNASFKIARLSKNGCVLFFDEFDGIASKNANLNLRATMLDLIVKSREIPNLVLIGATNYKEYLDEASIREGRFDTKIRINNPSKEDIFDLLRNFLKEIDKITDKNKIENKISHQMYERIFDYLYSLNETSRSIAGIKSFANNLKRQSFFDKKQDSEKRLIIDDETVLDYLAKS